MDIRKAYSEDPRIPCHYGRKCYQKNPNHHIKYKHPPDPKRKNQYSLGNGIAKKMKLNDANEDNNRIYNPSLADDEENNTESLVNAGSSNKKPEFSNDVSEDESEDESKDVLTSKNKNNDHENLLDADNESSNKKVTISNNVSESESEDETKDVVTSKSQNIDHDSITDNSQQVQVHTNGSNVTRNLTCDHKDGHNNDQSKEYIRSKFLTEMPEDFFKFFDLCVHLNKENPSEALAGIGLKLVGPFDVLCGKFCGVDKKSDDYLIHWRYYYDPPNFQTVLKGVDRTGYHIGYFRDNPDEKPVFLAENSGLKDGILTPIGGNIFGALSSYIEDRKKTCDPFSKLKFNKIHNLIKEEAEKLNFDLSRKTKEMVKRNNKVLSRTFNKVGLVVPYERKTQLGYRKLAMSEKSLEALLTKINKAEPEDKSKLLGELQSEILTWTDIACDECDFGTGIELGWNILCHGVDLNHTISRLLSSNYRQLKWESFAKIAEAHMNNRKKGSDLSIL